MAEPHLPLYVETRIIRAPVSEHIAHAHDGFLRHVAVGIRIDNSTDSAHGTSQLLPEKVLPTRFPDSTSGREAFQIVSELGCARQRIKSTPPINA